MSEKNEWKLVPVEPTDEMWAAVNKLDDQMAAGGYDGKGASIEQAWNCLVETAPDAPPLTVVLDPDPRGVSVGVYQGSSCVYNGAHPIPTGATGEEQDDSIALDKLADYIADNWPDKKYGLEEICQRLHAMWPGEFISLEDLSKNLPNVREALRALLIHWKRFQKSGGNQQDAYNLMVKGARHAWQFAEVEINRVPVGPPAAGDALDVLILTQALQELRHAFVLAVGDKSPFARMALEKADAALAAAQRKGDA